MSAPHFPKLALVSIAALVVAPACAPAPPPERPAAHSGPAQAAAAPPPSAAPPSAAAQLSCEDSVECTLVADACGRLVGRHHRDTSAIPPADARCPSTRILPRAPTCIARRCTAELVDDAERFACEDDSGCALTRDVCGAHKGVARGALEAFERETAELGAITDCDAPPTYANARARCLYGTCAAQLD